MVRDPKKAHLFLSDFRQSAQRRVLNKPQRVGRWAGLLYNADGTLMSKNAGIKPSADVQLTFGVRISAVG